MIMVFPFFLWIDGVFICSQLINQNAQFRKRCNAFFIDMVSTVCFKDNTPPCQNIIHHLLSFLMVEVQAVPIIRSVLEQLFMFVWVYICVCGILMCFFPG